MRTVLLAFFLTFAAPLFCQDWVNVNSPFRDPTPSPTWKTGNFIEILYELDRKNEPETTDLKDWIQINDLIVTSLTTEFSIGAKTYKVELPGTSVVGGVYRFRIYGHDYDEDQTIREKNWKYLSYKLSYSGNDIKKSTQLVQHNNQAYQGAEGNISINRLEYNISNREFDIDVYSSHPDLNFASSKIKATQAGENVSNFTTQSGPEAIFDNNENKYRYRLKLLAKSGFIIEQLASGNGHKLFVQVNAASATNPAFAQAEGMHSLNYDVPLTITEISGITVYGTNPAVVRITTSLLSNSFKLVFDESPFEQSSSLTEIVGQPQGELPTNIFAFPVASDGSNFKYGNFRFHFEGKPAIGNPIGTNSYSFTKREVDQPRTHIVQTGSECTIRVSFQQASPGAVQLVFAETQDTKNMVRVGSSNDYEVKLNLGDAFIKENLREDASVNYLNTYISAYGKRYGEIGFAVAVIDADEAVEELEGISGGKNKRKELIREYLSDKNVVGDTEQMTELIFNELAKSRDDRDWSSTWNSVGKFLRPLPGLLMMFI